MDYHEDFFCSNDDHEIQVEIVYEKEWQEAEKDIGISSGWIAHFEKVIFEEEEDKNKWNKLSLENKMWYREKWMENIESIEM